jgi:peptide deformylase
VEEKIRGGRNMIVKPRGYNVDCPVYDEAWASYSPTYSISEYTKENYKEYPHFLSYNTFLSLDRMDNKEAFKIGRKMVELAKKANGQGLAANQIQVLSPIMVMLLNDEWKIFYLPIPAWLAKESMVDKEECLSLPGISVKVRRPVAVGFSAIVNPAGKRKKYELYGQDARLFLHEYSHLLGKTILD